LSKASEGALELLDRGPAHALESRTESSEELLPAVRDNEALPVDRNAALEDGVSFRERQNPGPEPSLLEEDSAEVVLEIRPPLEQSPPRRLAVGDRAAELGVTTDCVRELPPKVRHLVRINTAGLDRRDEPLPEELLEGGFFCAREPDRSAGRPESPQDCRCLATCHEITPGPGWTCAPLRTHRGGA